MDSSRANAGKHLAARLLADYLRSLQATLNDPASAAPPDPATLQRTWTFRHYVTPMLDQYVDWLGRSREHSNFTYELTGDNEQQLAGAVDAVTGCGIPRALELCFELKNDHALRAHINGLTSASSFRDFADLNAGYGRRLGWYALIRVTRPRVVVETGVDKGLGSCVIAAALLRNRAEGFPGRYYGTEINPQAGYLFKPPYSEAGEILYGDSITSLRALDQPIDLFINDSDHSADYEANEYRTVHTKLAYRAIVLGDNAHATPALFNYAMETGKRFLFFAEKPKDHFYPGAGIGICY